MASDPQDAQSRDAAHWAPLVERLKVSDVPSGAVSLNVEGRQVVGPLQGFGQLWQKTYRLRMAGAEVSPATVIDHLKHKLPDLMPAGSRFYPSIAGVEPGELVLINASLPGIPGIIATGVMVLYSDSESFTLMCPQGHPEAGWNTFSAYAEGGVTVAQIQSLARANDPVFEFGFRFLGGSAQQERIWHHLLAGLAQAFGVPPEVEFQKTLVDRRLQWSQAKNLWFNSAIRSTLNAPLRLVRRMLDAKG